MPVTARARPGPVHVLRRRRGSAGGGVTAGARPGPRGRRTPAAPCGRSGPRGRTSGSFAGSLPSHNSLYGTRAPAPPGACILDDHLLTSRTVCAPDLVPPRTRRRGCSRHGAPRCPPRPGGSSPSPTPSASSTALDREVLTRREGRSIEQLFGVSRARAATLMQTFGAALTGTQRTLPRERQLLRQLRKHRARAAFRGEARPPGAAPDRAPDGAADRDPGGRACRGARGTPRQPARGRVGRARDRIEVRFSGAQEAVARLFALAQALTHDYEQFEALVGRGEVSE